MRVAICDWDKDLIKVIKGFIYRYAESFKIEIVADSYFSGEELLKSNINYNIIFLGYKLRGCNGLETAKIIRNTNSAVTIVFVSEYTNFVFESFQVNPYRFLIKPVAFGDVFDIFDSYFSKCGTDYPLWIKSGEENVFLNTNNIYYLEANNKQCIIHLKNCNLICNKTMARVFEVLPKNHFCKTNRAFVVNLNIINSYNSNTVFLKNGQTIPLSRNYYKIFKEECKRIYKTV